MRRSHSAFPILILAALAMSGCAIGRPSVSSGGGEAEARVMYVRVSAGNPDAVLLDAPDPWAEVVAHLEFGNELVYRGSSRDGYLLVRTRGRGVEETGWIVRSAAGRWRPGEDRQYGPNPVQAARYLYPHEEFDHDADVQKKLEWLDVFEQVIEEQWRAGGATPDSATLRERFRAFGEVGGLLDD